MEYQIDIRPFQPEDQEALAGVIRPDPWPV